MSNLAQAQLSALGYGPTDTVFFRAIGPNGARKLDGTLVHQFDELQTLNSEGYGIYFVVNGGGHADANVKTGQAIFYEHDDLDKPIQIDLWQTLGLPKPTFQIDTGGKSIHSYWVLNHPMPIADWKVLQRDLLEFANADRSIKNPSRVMRLANFNHQKTGDESVIVSNGGARYSFEELRAIVTVPKPSPKPTRKKPSPVHLSICADDDLAKILERDILPRLSAEQIFNWSGHRFSAESDGKLKGSCPWHDSQSGTSFWVTPSQDGVTYTGACPTCTGNEKINAVAYRFALRRGGPSGQPTGRDFVDIARELADDAGVTIPEKPDRPITSLTASTAGTGGGGDDGDLWYSKPDGTRKLNAVSEIALILKERWPLSYDPYTQNLYHYGLESDGLWSACEETEIKKLIQSALQETGISHAPSKVNAIFEYLKVELSTRSWKKSVPKNLLPLRNGVFDTNTKTLYPHSPDYRFISQLPHEYNPIAICEPIIDWLSQTQNGDPERVQLLRAYLKAGVIGAASLQRFLELIGPGGAGKSTYANLMIALIGRENCYVTSIEELEQNRFATAAIYGKRLVYIVDADGYSRTLSKFKALTGQDILPFERKNRDSRTGFTYQGMVIYVANTPLASSDNTSGLERRRLTVPFNNQIALGKQRPLIEFHDDGSVTGDFVPHLPGLLNWALEMSDVEMFELIKNTAVSVPSLAAAKIDVLTTSNSLAAWLEDCCIFAPGSRSQIGTANKIQVTRELGGDRITKSEYQNEDIWLYASYRAYCERTGHSKPVTMRKFSDSLVDLCRNQLKNPEVEKLRGRDGAAIVGITLRSDSDKDSPTPISGGRTAPQSEEASSIPDEVWASIDESIQPEVKVMVEEVWGYANQDDREFVQSFGDWVARHSKKPKWQKLRAETWRYLKSTDHGRSIARRLKSFEQKQNHSVAA